MINEAADLFESSVPRGRAVGDTDLLTALSDRIEWLVERHRATRRAVDELGSALAERDRRIVELDAKLAGFERLRGELLGKIDALVGDLDRVGSGSGDRAA